MAFKLSFPLSENLETVWGLQVYVHLSSYLKSTFVPSHLQINPFLLFFNLFL